MTIDFSNPAHCLLFCVIVLAWTGIGIGAGTDNNTCSLIAAAVMITAILCGLFNLGILIYRAM
jgi:hypothetical protein